ncbi:glycosyltransferase family 2 protein [Streptomyces luteogriseus]|uniref:glycosyltransferase family 2 protein n=1 Tax=Streptomyces luteogriseus TaxID=68233 RepID=UPI0038157DED
MNGVYRVAVIPTRDRHDLLTECVGSVVDQVDSVLIVDNLSDPPVEVDQWHGKVGVVRLPVDPPNISTFWNTGIALADAAAHRAGAEQWDIAVLNSDVVAPPGWVMSLSMAMRGSPAVLAYPDQHGGSDVVLHTKAEPIDLRQRITGFAYLLRGEAGLRLDESMAWWYSDDDLDWRAREQGGALLVPGLAVDHRCPNGSMYERPELGEQAGRDRVTFAEKWGRTPW